MAVKNIGGPEECLSKSKEHNGPKETLEEKVNRLERSVAKLENNLETMELAFLSSNLSPETKSHRFDEAARSLRTKHKAPMEGGLKY